MTLDLERRLALVVSTAPERGDLDRALALARGARSAGVEVGLFFMDHAVAGLPARRAQLSELEELGCELCACATSAQLLGLGEADIDMLLGSQDDHAALVHRAHRVVSLT
jgi:peroxiredoxin family protein